MSERLASFISGGGTTMEQIGIAYKKGEIPIKPVLVVSSNPKAGGIEKASRLGIPHVVVNPDDFRGEDRKVDQEGFGLALLKVLRYNGVTVITQNGWMPLTPEPVIDEFKETIFNQHPGPVPEFGGQGMYGRRVHATRLLFTRMTKRDHWTVATAQRVHKNYDQGAVVRATRVDILPDDTVDDLQQRVLPVEHRTQIDLLKDVASGNIREIPVEKLVRLGEEKALFVAKQSARLLYPHG